jgi:hypothetical protein
LRLYKGIYKVGKLEISAVCKVPTLIWRWNMPSSGMWRHVDLVWTDFSEERIASIFRVEKCVSEERAWVGGCINMPNLHNLKTFGKVYTIHKTLNILTHHVQGCCTVCHEDGRYSILEHQMDIQ